MLKSSTTIYIPYQQNFENEYVRARNKGPVRGLLRARAWRAHPPPATMLPGPKKSLHDPGWHLLVTLINN